MSQIFPFRALHPLPEFVEEVACPPYDVISPQEARQLAKNDPVSFVRVIRPEVDLPENIDPHDSRVYRQGASNLQEYANGSRFARETSPAVYVYRMVLKGRAQTGIFACVGTEDYKTSRILKHEKTRPAKETDRTEHILAQRAHAEPVMLTYRDNAEIDVLVDQIVQRMPLFDFTAPDGVRHQLWREYETQALVEAFRSVGVLYVADGHHRCAAATRAADQVDLAGGAHESSEHRQFPAVLIPLSQMQILAYNRVIFRLPGGPTAFKDALETGFNLASTDNPVPARPGIVCLYLQGRWYELALPPSESTSASGQLDVARLTTHILEPLLHIGDPRTDPNIEFVGGARGTAFLENLVDSDRAEIAISMYPTHIDELVAVSDAGELMPPKTTWFEPKLRTGLLIHEF